MGPSKGIFDGESDSESDIKTKNEYARNYNVWRNKEELNKLKTKYGEEVLENDGSSSSSDDDEFGTELTEDIEKDFFKTLSYLKKKDPKIYDTNVNFFNRSQDNIKREKKKKDVPMFIKDYERKFILEKGGVLSDEDGDDSEARPRSPTYVEEQKKIKKDLKKALDSINEDDDNENNWGGLFKAREKSNAEQENDEAEYKRWLAGQVEEIEDNNIKSELKPLKDFWNDPNLEKGEKFLRDYILNKKYLDKEGDDYIPTYEEIIHDSDESLSGDEKAIDIQEEFEHKYNFRFEEPDQDFIKRYPRTIEQSLRKTDDKRKVKRAETKVRKQKEKEEKMADIRKMQELKRKEIEDKIEKLKEITGNTDVGFQVDDVDGDFDPDAHDKRMHSLFNEEFYDGTEEDQKPNFPDIDEELEIENWDHWNAEENNVDGNYANDPHCEDENFNMDADYVPSTSLKDELIESTKSKKKRRKSKVAEALSKPKPKYDPKDKNYEKYFDEYYKLDCEDIIGDLPCRFKYREVIPNDFGLTIEEILLAKDRELNRWCSLKKAVQHRPANVEKYEQIAYSKKSQNMVLKKKILPSLFSDDADEDQNVTEQPSKGSEGNQTNETKDEAGISPVESENNEDKNKSALQSPENKSKKKTRSKKKKKKTETNDIVLDNVNSQSKVSSGDFPEFSNKNTNLNNNVNVSDQEVKKSKKRKRGDSNQAIKNDIKKPKKMKNKHVNPGMSDARLSAYGINPKKFKNKLKYGNKK